MRKLVLLSRKGGTGKTTLSVNLAVAAVREGLGVTIADLDLQGSAGAWAAMRGGAPPQVRPANGGTLFPVANAAERAGQQLLIMDTPAGGDALSSAAIRLADLAILVCRPSYFDLAALVPAAQAVRAAGCPGLVVLNQAPPRRGGQESPAIGRAVEAAKVLGFPIAPIGLRARVAFQESLWRGQGVQEFEPRGVAAAEIGRLWSEVSDQLWPSRVELRGAAE
ncbi:MAG TPA: ParA family protein [Caulobacter sp.]|nr:ParA family protein [Caulobacter sp.]